MKFLASILCSPTEFLASYGQTTSPGRNITSTSRACLLKDCLRALKSFIKKKDLMCIYDSLLRSILEYCSPLFIGMPSGMAHDLEKLQRRAHRVICGSTCEDGCLDSLGSRRERRAKDLFKQCLNRNHLLNHLLPPSSKRSHTLRFLLPHLKTSRRSSSFIPCMCLRQSGFV